jgi:hypothetical protein
MRTITHPIFLACREKTEDLFWKGIFENLAYGKTPRGVYLKGNCLYSVTKKKEFTYNFDNQPADKIYTEVLAFLIGYGVKTKTDLSRKKQAFDQYQQTNSTRKSENLWTKIKKKNVRDDLIQEYVLSCQKKYSLSDEKTKELYFFVTTGIVFKIFTGADVILVDGYIEIVHGIEFTPGTSEVPGNFTITRQFKKPTFKKTSSREVYLYELWNSYLKSGE